MVTKLFIVSDLASCKKVNQFEIDRCRNFMTRCASNKFINILSVDEKDFNTYSTKATCWWSTIADLNELRDVATL